MKAIRRLGAGALLATSMLILPVFKVQASLIDPPSIAQAFSPSSILLLSFSTLTFTITNPGTNTSAEVGVAFSDTIPTGFIFPLPLSLIRAAARPQFSWAKEQ